MRVQLRLDLPRDARWVPVARGLAGCVLAQADAPAGDVADVQLALTEACANAVCHAVGTDAYAVGLSIEPGGCEVEVADAGPGFGDDAGVGGGRRADGDADAEPAAGSDADAESGRGLELMRALVDDLELAGDADATRIVLRKSWRAELDPAALAALDAGAVPLRHVDEPADSSGGRRGERAPRRERTPTFCPEDGERSSPRRPAERAHAGGSMPWARSADAVASATGPRAVSHTWEVSSPSAAHHRGCACAACRGTASCTPGASGRASTPATS